MKPPTMLNELRQLFCSRMAEYAASGSVVYTEAKEKYDHEKSKGEKPSFLAEIRGL